MKRYIEFNAVKFLKESKQWEKEKADLQKQMDELAEIQKKGGNNGKSSHISDSTALSVIDRQKIQLQIDRINNYQSALSYAWRRIPQAHRDVLTAFFFTDGKMSHNITNCAQSLAVCVNKVYTMRREALAEVADLVEEWYN